MILCDEGAPYYHPLIWINKFQQGTVPAYSILGVPQGLTGIGALFAGEALYHESES